MSAKLAAWLSEKPKEMEKALHMDRGPQLRRFRSAS